MKSNFLTLLLLCASLPGCIAGCQNAELPASEPASRTLRKSVSHAPPLPERHGFRPGALGMKPPLLTEREQLDRHIGQLVAIRGTVSSSKAATIIGVNVNARFELRGKDCYAVGILAKWTSTQRQLDEMIKKHGPVAASGPGTTYTLYSDLNGKGAEAREWPSITGRHR